MAKRFRTVVRYPGDPPSLAASVALTLLAPLTVVAALEVSGNALVTFVVYHGIVCLGLPAALSYHRGLSWSAHLKWLGWRDASNDWAGGVGLVTGVVGGLLVFGFLGTVGVRLVAPGSVAVRLAAWGLAGSAVPLLVPYMIVVNSVAEELFWRGALHTRFEGVASRPLALAGVSAAFASYHGYTVHAILGRPWVAAGVTVAVFAGAVVWAGLREFFGSVKPAVYAHVGASAGYMVAHVVWFA